MLENLTTEIRSFYSLQDLRESIDEEISKCKTVVDEYSQWLGSLLRDMEAIHGNEEWFKRLSHLRKFSKKESMKEGKRGRIKKSASYFEWIPYKDIMLSADEQAEAEILFDAIEELNEKIEQLTKVKNAIADLEKSALGKDIIYVTYIHDGVPEKIVLRHKKGKELEERFKFTADFSVLKEVFP
jgi:hypothetical protein